MIILQLRSTVVKNTGFGEEFKTFMGLLGTETTTDISFYFRRMQCFAGNPPGTAHA